MLLNALERVLFLGTRMATLTVVDATSKGGNSVSSLAALRRLSKQLNESTDKLNQALSKAETEFKDLNIGCTAWVKEPISFGDSWTTRGERFYERYVLSRSDWL